MEVGTPLPVLVLGLGNPLRGDDGVGPAVIEALRQVELPPEVELMDGGTAGLGLLTAISGRRHLLVVDAAEMGRPPGTVEVFSPREGALEKSEDSLSPHQLGLAEVLEVAGRLELAPQTVKIFAVQPDRLDWGQELGPAVRNSLSQVVSAIREELNDLS